MDRYLLGAVTRPISEVRLGDRIDLQGDTFADPDGSLVAAEFEFARVDAIGFESHDIEPVIALYTSQGAFGFPIDHFVGVDPEQRISKLRKPRLRNWGV